MKAYGGMEVYHQSLIAKQGEEDWTASHTGGGGLEHRKSFNWKFDGLRAGSVLGA